MKYFVTREEAAEMLGVSKTMIDIYRIKGYLIPVPTKEGRIFFRKEHVKIYKRVRAARLREKKKRAQMKALNKIKTLNPENENN